MHLPVRPSSRAMPAVARLVHLRKQDLSGSLLRDRVRRRAQASPRRFHVFIDHGESRKVYVLIQRADDRTHDKQIVTYRVRITVRGLNLGCR